MITSGSIRLSLPGFFSEIAVSLLAISPGFLAKVNSIKKAMCKKCTLPRAAKRLLDEGHLRNLCEQLKQSLPRFNQNDILIVPDTTGQSVDDARPRSEDELDEQATTEDFSVVQAEGARKVRRRLKHYNLDGRCRYRRCGRRGWQCMR